ncbi:hypothetical protein PENANT_c108G00997 [Penicillium antarcticum]|uniref:Uncharacterized protein n=1 Tax=Penicillium antarcticum TaxID=416450 RepID=A0A1V6PK58_9EURO|nr:hypothetical protein PENANT_c108G00997 [Penicillium antarcticum]
MASALLQKLMENDLRHYSTEYNTTSPEVRSCTCEDASDLNMQEFILFVGVERSADDLNVTFFNRNGQQRASWRVFKSLGERAMEAVVTAGWILYKLEGIAQSVHEGTFDQHELDELKDSAKERSNKPRLLG